MRPWSVLVTAALLVAPAGAAQAQERVRISINAGQQATSTSFTEEQTIEQYHEQGSLSFGRRIPSALFYDAGVAIRIWRGLRAGVAVSLFEDSGTGEVTALVPHPLRFDEHRTVTGEVAGTRRRELGGHLIIGWTIPAGGALDFTVFGGPSLFSAEQLFATTLMLSLEKEEFPFDTLEFPGVVTETQQENVVGYNAGVDMTWRFSRNVGLGALIRYASGRRDFTPTGGQAVPIDVGGLHAGAGVRLMF